MTKDWERIESYWTLLSSYASCAVHADSFKRDLDAHRKLIEMSEHCLGKLAEKLAEIKR